MGDTQGREGPRDLWFSVVLSPPTTGQVTVDYATRDVAGTAHLGGRYTAATPGEDYTAISGTLTFTATSTRRTIRVALEDDDVEDDSEVFEVVLSNPVGALLGDPVGLGIIYNDDRPRAELRGVPAFHAGGSFTVELAFSEAVEVDAHTLRAALTVRGGSLASVRATSGTDTHSWRLTVQPEGTHSAVVLSLAAAGGLRVPGRNLHRR